MIQVTIYDSKMMIADELGIMPHNSGVGGYLASLTVILRTCVVRH